MASDNRESKKSDGNGFGSYYPSEHNRTGVGAELIGKAREAADRMRAANSRPQDLGSATGRMKENRAHSYDSIRTDSGHPPARKSGGPGFQIGD